MHTYKPGIILDPGTLRGLANVPVEVLDDESETPVQVYRDGVALPALVSGPYGFILPFQTDDSTRRVRLTAGSYSQVEWALEALAPPPDTGPQPVPFLDTGATPHSTVNWIRRTGNRVTIAVGWSTGPGGAASVFALPSWAATENPVIVPCVGGGYMSFTGTVCRGYQLTANAQQYAHATWYTTAPFPTDTELNGGAA